MLAKLTIAFVAIHCISAGLITPSPSPSPSPSKCAANETFTECSNTCFEGDCMKIKLHMEVNCIFSCGPPACVCKKGYARDNSHKCILKEECPDLPKCSDDEHIDNCPGSCNEPACGDGGRKWCARLSKCPPPACACNEGLVRNGKRGACIPRSQCPPESSTPAH